MSQEKQPSFLDSKTIMAILLVGMSWIAWQSYMKKKYPHVYEQQPQVEQSAEATNNPEGGGKPDASSATPNVENSGNNVNEATPPSVQASAAQAETLVHYEDEYWSFDISSKGMGIKNLRLKKYTDRENNLVTVGQGSPEPMFASNLSGRRGELDFSIEEIGEGQFKGVATTELGQVTKLIRLKSSQYVFENEVVATDLKPSFVGLTVSMGDKVYITEGGSFMLPAFDHQEFFVRSKSGTDRLVVNSEDLTEIDQTTSQVRVGALGTQYFAQGIIDRSDVIPEFKTYGDSQGGMVTGRLQYTMLNKADVFKIQYRSFAGPKSFEMLEKIDSEFAEIVNFGMFSWIAKYILHMMKWFYSLLGNWGLAIILLTIIVRIVVLPFAMMSYKSMKNMQTIQPQIKALREKYAEDKQRLNQEMMSLMKNHRVNPLGGCLPMFLQFPVFIALYQVLGQSIELYQAPFGLWIHDLSLKDPFYVLPVLMGVTMFIQQKITPNTMDPAQAKVLMFMPLLFTFFMVSLPSGLTLYIFISALFGILQQMYFMREKKTELKTVEVAAK
ncbi:MAG: membrane protein insertase YidC [Bdellovibrionales bacterium]|nr:membrane protein insertase YidC [Bdellovibrionales bacterium]